MLHEPTPSIPTLAPPAAATVPEPRDAPDARSATPDLPPDLRSLARRARRDEAATRALVAALLGRHWEVEHIALATGTTSEAVASLAGVRRPGTAAGFVADEVAARARSRTGPTPRTS